MARKKMNNKIQNSDKILKDTLECYVRNMYIICIHKKITLLFFSNRFVEYSFFIKISDFQKFED